LPACLCGGAQKEVPWGDKEKQVFAPHRGNANKPIRRKGQHPKQAKTKQGVAGKKGLFLPGKAKKAKSATTKKEPSRFPAQTTNEACEALSRKA